MSDSQMNKRHRIPAAGSYIWIGLTVAFAIAAVVLLSYDLQYKKDITELKSGKNQLKREIKQLKVSIEDLTCEKESLEKKQTQLQNKNKILKSSIIKYRRKLLHQPRLCPQEILELKEKGLKDPVNDIVSDLMKHKELIPYEGIMGGSMGFNSKQDIYVLSTHWVRAYFDDGHISGWLLLEYYASKDWGIFWEVVDSYLNEQE